MVEQPVAMTAKAMMTTMEIAFILMAVSFPLPSGDSENNVITFRLAAKVPRRKMGSRNSCFESRKTSQFNEGSQAAGAGEENFSGSLLRGFGPGRRRAFSFRRVYSANFWRAFSRPGL
jgi:hypothetical protein